MRYRKVPQNHKTIEMQECFIFKLVYRCTGFLSGQFGTSRESMHVNIYMYM